MRSGYTQTFAGGYHATWRTVFKNFARRPPVRRFWPRVAPILAEGANGLPELDLLESAMAASTLRITEVSEGGSVPFLRAENVGRKPVLIPGRGGTCRREAEPDRQRQHHHPPGRGDRHPGVLHGGGQVELQPAGLPGGRGGVPGQVAGGAEGERRGKPGCGRKLPQRPGRGLA